jgi:anti-sigma regulatory factor (Ser/Thr protein kinase)
MQEFRFEMPANLEFVPVIRVALQNIAFIFGFSDKEAYEIEFVVDEICNNAIEHGSKGKDKTITMECKFDKQYIEIIVKDSGSPHFNVDEILKEGRRLMEEESEKQTLNIFRRKRGLIIVQKYVDKMDITSDPNGTIVKMVKKSHKDSLD